MSRSRYIQHSESDLGSPSSTTESPSLLLPKRNLHPLIFNQDFDARPEWSFQVGSGEKKKSILASWIGLALILVMGVVLSVLVFYYSIQGILLEHQNSYK